MMMDLEKDNFPLLTNIDDEESNNDNSNDTNEVTKNISI